jgi:hypothetical protein
MPPLLFQNFYLELLWVSDADEVRSEPAARLRFSERWSRRAEGACPFGVMVRAGPEASPTKAPFEVWAYQPRYLPAHLSIGVASDAPLEEPGLFYFPFAREPRRQSVEPTAHALALGRLTSVAIGTPWSGTRTAGSKALESLGLLQFRPEAEYVLHLTFDEGRGRRVDDLRPALPLVLHS